MHQKEAFENLGLAYASKVVDVYRFLHESSNTFYRLEIAQTSDVRYTAVVYYELKVEGEEEISTLKVLASLPRVDEHTSEEALETALNFLEHHLSAA